MGNLPVLSVGCFELYNSDVKIILLITFINGNVNAEIIQGPDWNKTACGSTV